jgi:hypothetical protein
MMRSGFRARVSRRGTSVELTHGQIGKTKIKMMRIGTSRDLVVTRVPPTSQTTGSGNLNSALGGGVTNCRATTREAVPQADRSTGAELIQNAKAEPTGYFSVAHPPRLASQGTSPRVTGSPRWQRRVPPDPRGPIALVEPERWRSHPAVIRFRE